MKCPNCNETDHKPSANYCHICGVILNPELAEFYRRLRTQGETIQKTWEKLQNNQTNEDNITESMQSKVIRYILLLVVLAEYIFISIMEIPLFEPWGQVTVAFVNGFSFLMTLILCIQANHNDQFEDKTRFWKSYYKWLHFIVAAIVPLIGYLILCMVQNFLTLVLEGTLVGIILLADFGTLEDFFDL